MSADGTGLLIGAAIGLAVLPVIAAGAAVSGVAYGAIKVASTLMDSRRKRREQEQKEQQERQRKIAQMEASQQKQINSLYSRLDALNQSQFEAQNRIDDQFANSYEALARSLQKQNKSNDQTIRSLEAQSVKHLFELVNQWESQTKSLEQNYSGQIKNLFDSIKEQINQRKQNNQMFFDDIQKEHSLVQKTTLEQIDQAEAYLQMLILEGFRPSASLIKAYERSKKYYSDGLYSNAYSVACNVSLEALSNLEQDRLKKAQADNLRSEILVQGAMIQNRIDVLKDYSCSIGSKTYRQNLIKKDYFSFKGLEQTLVKLQSQAGNSQNPMELVQTQRQMNILQNDAASLINHALELFITSIIENNEATKISQIMKEQGFQLIGYSYAQDVNGKPLHINYENPISKDKVTVVLIPQKDGIRVSIHQYGNGWHANAQRQQQLTHALSKALNIQISCHNPGAVSRQNIQSNLDQVKKGGVHSE